MMTSCVLIVIVAIILIVILAIILIVILAILLIVMIAILLIVILAIMLIVISYYINSNNSYHINSNNSLHHLVCCPYCNGNALRVRRGSSTVWSNRKTLKPLVNLGGSWHEKLTLLVTHFSLLILAYPFQGH